MAASTETNTPFHQALHKMNVNWRADRINEIDFLLPNGQYIVVSIRDIEAMIEHAINIPLKDFVNYGEVTMFNFHDRLIQEMKIIIHGYRRKSAFTDGYKEYDDSKGRGSAKERRQQFRDRFQQAAGDPDDYEHQTKNAGQPTVHDILGVKPGATKDEIKKAYRKKMREWHPDLNSHRQDEATEMSKKINDAYDVLTKYA